MRLHATMIDHRSRAVFSRDMAAPVTTSTGNPVVFLSGDIDIATAQGLASALEPLVRAGGPVVLDVSKVSFVDSTGLHVLIVAAKTLADRGCIIVHGAHGQLSTVLQTTKIDQLLENVHFVMCDVLVTDP
jgi:anti-sigma B factor antagonist